MNAAPALLHIAMAPLQHWRNQTARWLRGVILAAPLVGLTITAIVGPPKVLTGVAFSLGVTAFVAAWLVLVASLVSQNQPRAARLVPGHVLRLRQVLLGAWGLLCGLALLAGFWIGKPLPALMGAAVVLLALAVSARWPTVWALLWVVPTFGFWFAKKASVAAVLSWLAQCYEAMPGLATAIVLGTTALLLAQLLQTGGARHERSHRKYQRRSVAMRQGLAGSAAVNWKQQSRLGHWLQRISTAPYQWWFARQVARPQGPVLARALLALGPAGHWTGHAGAALIGVLIGGTIAAASWRFWNSGAVHVNLMGLGIGLMIFAINPVLQARSALHNSRREQALMMLLPGMPRGGALNRAWARRQMAHFLVAWSFGSAVALLVVNRWNDLPVATLFLCMACLPMGLTLWRNWARVKPPSAFQAVLLILTPMVASALGWAGQHWLGLAPLQWVLLCVAVTVVLGVWRWRQLGRFAGAFPAGRAG